MAKKTKKTNTTDTDSAIANGECMCASCPTGSSGWGLLGLRIVVGLFFVLHGITKFMGLEGTGGFFGSLGIPSWMAIVVASVEVLAGLALVLGIWSRYGGYAIATIMVSALSFAHYGWGAFSWIAIMLLLVGLAMLEFNKQAKWGCWIVGLVIATVLSAGFWMQIAGGINISAATARDMTFLAAALAIAWSGPGCLSIHNKCNCSH